MAFDEKYFSTNAYQDVSFAKYSQYWWSNRFYAILARRYGQRGTTLLEIGSGLGHLVGQLDGFFATAAVDVNHWALVQSKAVAPRTLLQVASAEGLPFAMVHLEWSSSSTWLSIYPIRRKPLPNWGV